MSPVFAVKHPAPHSTIWHVLIGVAFCLWMIWEITARSMGWTAGAIRYPAMIVCIAGVCTWNSYRRWRDAQEDLAALLAP